MSEKRRYITTQQSTTAICFLHDNRATLTAMSRPEIRECIAARCGFTVLDDWLTSRLREIGIQYKTHDEIVAANNQEKLLELLPGLIGTNAAFGSSLVKLDKKVAALTKGIVKLTKNGVKQAKELKDFVEWMADVHEQASLATETSTDIDIELDKLRKRVEVLEKANAAKHSLTITAPPPKAEAMIIKPSPAERSTLVSLLRRLSGFDDALAVTVLELTNLIQETNERLAKLTTGEIDPDDKPVDMWEKEWMATVSTALSRAASIQAQHLSFVAKLLADDFDPYILPVCKSKPAKSKHNTQDGQLSLIDNLDE